MHNKIKAIAICMCALLMGLDSHSAEVPAPGAAQSRPIFLVGATVHVGDGSVIENATVGFRDGKLTMVESVEALLDQGSDADIRDVSGKHIYPGLIAPATNLGLTEIGAVRATRDFNEVGRINPNIRSIIAFNTDSRVIPTVRSNGILMAQITPTGGLIPGSSSIVQFDAWNWQDASYQSDDGVHLNWPNMGISTSDEEESEKQEKRRKRSLAELRSFFDDAKAYAATAASTPRNLKLEAMRGLFDGSKKLFIRSNEARGIIAALNFALEYGITPVLVGAADAWMLTDMLKANNVAVILARTHRLPRRRHEDIDQPFKTPALLRDAGLRFCLAGNGNWDQRNLPFLAGTAAAYGLSKEEALKAISLSTAEILGIADRTGSLTVGKDATLLVVDGDLLDMRSSRVEQAFIQGREVDLDNKQKMLYRKFMQKYGLKPTE